MGDVAQISHLHVANRHQRLRTVLANGRDFSYDRALPDERLQPPKTDNAMNIDLKDQIRTYWHERARAFDDIASHRKEADIWERALTLAVDHVPRGSTVLDLGAGTGACALVMARLGHLVTAVDIAPAMLEQLERRADAEGLAIETLVTDVEALAMPPGSVDLVTMRNLLWTLARPADLLKKVRHILRPDGVLLIADGFWDHDLGEHAPTDAHWSHDRFIELYRPIAGELPYCRGISTTEIDRLVTAAGFDGLRHWSDRFERSPYAGVTDDFFLLTASVETAAAAKRSGT